MSSNGTGHVVVADEATEFIVFGYIRIIERSLLICNDHAAYYLIPRGIYDLCLLMVDTHFLLHLGSYEWTISDPKLFGQMLCAENKEQFVSPLFEVGGLKWIVQGYPNGIDRDSIGLFDIFVKLLSLPTNWDHIVVRRTIECIESSSKYTCIASYEKDSSFGWCDGALSLSEAATFQSLSFVIKIHILRIESALDHSLFFELEHDDKVHDEKQFQIEWRIDEKVMKTMKASNTGKCYESEMDGASMWCIQCFPNGDNAASAGDVELYVQVCWLPPGISRLEVRYSLSCNEAKAKDTRIKEFDYDNDQSAKWSHGVLSFAAFQELDTVTFTADITILNRYNLKGHLVDDAESEWLSYLERKRHFKERQTRNRQNEHRTLFQSLHCRMERVLSVMDDIKKGQNQNGLNLDLNLKSNVNATKTANAERTESERMKTEKNGSHELMQWLRDTVGLSQYFHVLCDHGFDDLETMKYLKINEMQQIGITKIGHRLKLMDYIQQMFAGDDP